MALTTELTRTLSTTPLYAAAGVVDLYVEQLRTVPAYARSVRVERRDIESAVNDMVERSEAAYSDLVARGRSVVGRIRRQQASQDLEVQAKSTVRRTKAATTTARTSTEETATEARRAAKRTATTARKNAVGTRTATKGAATSARRTTKAAAKAVNDGAAKIG